MEYKSAYKDINCRKFNTWCNYSKRIDTYGNGCMHECHYCYAKSLLNFRGFWNKTPLPSNLIQIHSAIKKLKQTDIVRLGSMTDCFQPLEKHYNLTYNTIRLLNHYKINYLIVTKSDLVADDKYIKIYDRNLAHFQVSLTATNNKNSYVYENATNATDRIKTVEKLYENGFDVSIRLSPFLPEFINYSTLNKIKCNKILIEFLKVNGWTKKNFKYDISDYKFKYGGHLNLEIENKINLLKNIDNFEQISVGEYVKEHHEYFKENVNFNKNDCCNLKLNLPIFNNYEQLKLC